MIHVSEEMIKQLEYSIERFNYFTQTNTINKENYSATKKMLEFAIPLYINSILTYSEGFGKIQRITINKNIFGGEQKRINEVKFLKYPPSQLVTRNGRANYERQSILYATFNPLTAIKEMKPEINDLITISTWQINTNNKLKLSPVFKISDYDSFPKDVLPLSIVNEYRRSMSDLPKSTLEYIETFMEFVALCFRKNVISENHYDYLLSAFFANKILNPMTSEQPDGILYSSVADKYDCTNIAIKPEIFDKSFKLVKVEECLFVSIRNEGIQLLSTGNSVINDGVQITWNSN